ncbi:MAG: hypothetical protein IPG23_15145 [Burkholderiales bacterium]|nr:hypothetical protein [Burkholderiales bacterium]
MLSHRGRKRPACCARPGVSAIRTAGEVGALLLEASLIKQQQPLYNQKLRRTKQLCSWLLTDHGAQIVYSQDVNFATQKGFQPTVPANAQRWESMRY